MDADIANLRIQRARLLDCQHDCSRHPCLGNGQIFHVYLPGTAPELATITDFNGVLAATEILGSWSGGGVTPPADTPLVFDADVRFMDGEYIGRDSRHHQGTFAFV